ncbi:MAG: hypothetical protein K6C99_02895 [Lachnospiraceae bacterium]|nr:hypothetical protein [Lachnospiraceae bacterium]
MSLIDQFFFLDTDAGLAYCGDDEELYGEILREYVDANHLDKLNTLFAEENWPDYQICIHAVKSSSKTIGAFELYEHAMALEHACKESDLEYIKLNHADVMDEYAHMVSNIKSAFEEE